LFARRLQRLPNVEVIQIICWLTKPSKTGEELKGEDQQGAESEVTDISNS
jgi:hypothetical protein